MKDGASPATKRIDVIHFFFSTHPEPCHYIKNAQEMRIVTELKGKDCIRFFNHLSSKGYRRNSSTLYTTVCENCNKCIPIRIITSEFKPWASLRRSLAKNKDIELSFLPPKACEEHYLLFRAYLSARHHQSEMQDMTFDDYKEMIENTPVNTELAEFRQNGALIGIMLIDILDDGISAVYSFFDPFRSKDSLGSIFIALITLEAEKRGLPYLYLGYAIKGCKNMEYKFRFKPQEIFINNKWVKAL